MGFMDKAKKLAEQAQEKLEEAQTQFNASQGHGSPSAPSPGAPVQYDEHGRPIAQERPAAPAPGSPPAPETPDRPHGDPLAPEVPTEPATTPAPTPPPAPAPPPAAVATPAPAPVGAPAAHAGSQGVPTDRNTIDYSPPAMTSGDPLSG